MIEIWCRSYKPPKFLSDYSKIVNKILSKHFCIKLNEELEIDFNEESFYSFIDIEGKTVFRNNYFISEDTFNISLVYNNKPEKYKNIFLDNFYYLAKELDFKVELKENYYLKLNKKLSESTFFGFFLPKIKKSEHTDNFLSFYSNFFGKQTWQFSKNFDSHSEFEKQISRLLKYDINFYVPLEDFKSQVSLLKIMLI